MFLRYAAILGLVFISAACNAEDATTDEYEAEVVFVKVLSEYQGKAFRIDFDARWVVRLRKKDGSEATYAIHSPTHMHLNAEAVTGKTVRFRETITTLTSGRKLRTLERAIPETK